MSAQLAFDTIERPVAPGRTDTSRAAARKIQPDAATIRERVMRYIERQGETGATTWEIAVRLKLDILSVRPRVTELDTEGRIARTKLRRANGNGNKEIVWAVPAGESTT